MRVRTSKMDGEVTDVNYRRVKGGKEGKDKGNGKGNGKEKPVSENKMVADLLQDAGFQRKLIKYLQNGIPPSDNRGHWVNVQAKCHPVQNDIINSLRDLYPKGYWKSNSELIRSLISVGCCFLQQVGKGVYSDKSWSKEIMLHEGLMMIKQRQRINEFSSELQRAVYDSNTSEVNEDTIVNLVEKVLKGKSE